MSEIAVSNKFQKRGLGKYLIQLWLEYNKIIGFVELNGILKFCVQTNKAEWNKHVQKLYESYGFKKVAEKQYNNRTDNIYNLYYED